MDAFSARQVRDNYFRRAAKRNEPRVLKRLQFRSYAQCQLSRTVASNRTVRFRPTCSRSAMRPNSGRTPLLSNPLLAAARDAFEKQTQSWNCARFKGRSAIISLSVQITAAYQPATRLFLPPVPSNRSACHPRRDRRGRL